MPPVRVFLFYGFKYCIFSDGQSVIDLVIQPYTLTHTAILRTITTNIK